MGEDIELFRGVYDVLLTSFLMGVSLILSVRIGRCFGVRDQAGFLLYLWHTVLMFAYIAYTFANGGDALQYYYSGLENAQMHRDLFQDFNAGTPFIYFLSHAFVGLLNFSYLNSFLLFQFAGYIGLLCFYGVVNQVVQENGRKWLLWIVYLPSASFWSVALGKDSLAFMATGMALWAALDFKKRMPAFVFAIVSMTIVRPHIGLFMVMGYVLALIFDKRTSFMLKSSMFLLTAAAMAALIPFVLQFAGLEASAGAGGVGEYIESRQNYNTEGGSSIDITQMSLPMQMITYLFRPFIVEVSSLFSLLAAIDNTLLLVVVVWGLWASIVKGKLPVVESNRVFLWIFSLQTWIVLSMTTANLGIAMRQKWMFLPMVVFLMGSLIPKRIGVPLRAENRSTLPPRYRPLTEKMAALPADDAQADAKTGSWIAAGVLSGFAMRWARKVHYNHGGVKPVLKDEAKPGKGLVAWMRDPGRRNITRQGAEYWDRINRLLEWESIRGDSPPNRHRGVVLEE